MPKESAKGATRKARYSSAPVRLWTKAKFLSYRRARDNVYHQQALVKLEGVNDRKQLTTYFGKRVAYIHKAQKSVKGSKFRVMWGRVARGHGNNGLALCKFKHNLPPRALGSSLRVFLYPQRSNTLQNTA